MKLFRKFLFLWTIKIFKRILQDRYDFMFKKFGMAFAPVIVYKFYYFESFQYNLFKYLLKLVNKMVLC